MKDVIYKFLDDYVGDGVVCKDPRGRGLLLRNLVHKPFAFYSNKGVLIFEVLITEDGDLFKLFCCSQLTKTVSGFFGIEDAASQIRDWFGQKYNMKKVSDIMKFIKNKDIHETNDS